MIQATIMPMKRIKYYRLSKREREAITARIKAILEEEEDVLLALLFGSFIELYSFRDIDIAVYTKGSEDLHKLFRLANKLEEEIGYPVDLVPLNAIPPAFRHCILTKGALLVEKEPGLYEALLLQTVDELKALKSYQ